MWRLLLTLQQQPPQTEDYPARVGRSSENLKRDREMHLTNGDHDGADYEWWRCPMGAPSGHPCNPRPKKRLDLCACHTTAQNRRTAGKRSERRENKQPVAGNAATLRRKPHKGICKLQPSDSRRRRLSTVDGNPTIAGWGIGGDLRLVDYAGPAHESAQQQPPTRSAPSVTAARTHAPHAQHKRPVHTPHTPTRARTLPPTLTGWSPSTGDTQPSHQHTKARSSSPHGQLPP